MKWMTTTTIDNFPAIHNIYVFVQDGILVYDIADVTCDLTNQYACYPLVLPYRHKYNCTQYPKMQLIMFLFNPIERGDTNYQLHTNFKVICLLGHDL